MTSLRRCRLARWATIWKVPKARSAAHGAMATQYPAMPVNRVRRSLDAEEIAVAALRARILLLDTAAVSCGSPGRVEMIPIYSIAARSVVLGRWNCGWCSGWRYFWTHEKLKFGITVEVRRGKDNHPQLASVSDGTSAPAISKQLARVGKMLAGEPNRFRPRILRLPWISMEAIWLNTDALDIPALFINRAGAPHGEQFHREAVNRARGFLDAREAARTTTKVSRARPSSFRSSGMSVIASICNRTSTSLRMMLSTSVEMRGMNCNASERSASTFCAKSADRTNSFSSCTRSSTAALKKPVLQLQGPVGMRLPDCSQ